MSDQFLCPYCGQPKDDGPRFLSCRFCGFRSALVDALSGRLLIVDRRMPFLQKRCLELKESHPDATVIVDRRIAQDPFGGTERRNSLKEGQSSLK